MYKTAALLVVILLSACGFTDVVAQVLPANGDTLNYRIVRFTVPEKKGATSHKLELYEYFLRDDGSIYTKLIFDTNATANDIMATVPAFGKTYTWRVKYLQKNKQVDSSKFYVFSTQYSKYTDTNKYRMQVLANTLDNKDYYILVDGTRTMYDKQGKPIWILPDIQGVVEDKTNIRDMKVTPFNTITFLTEKNAYEIDFSGNLLWQAPNDGKVSGDTTEQYHHEFTRLKKGTYMLISSKYVLREVPENFTSTEVKGKASVIEKEGKRYVKIISPTLIEYDNNGKVLWSWVANDIFNDGDIFTPNISLNGAKVNTHMNAFFFDEEKQVIYTSHRNINRIVKIAYPSGALLASYGEAYSKETEISGNGMFYGQHSCRISQNGQLYLFNNNNVHSPQTIQTRVSSVVFFNEPERKNDTLFKTWEYKRFEHNTDETTDAIIPSGGGVFELANTDILVCLGRSRNYIVSKNKTIEWEAVVEYVDENNNWQPNIKGYRSNIIESMEDFKRLMAASK